MKTREQHLESCKICLKRKFIMEKGLVCSLTNEWADFDEDCPDFAIDNVSAKQQENIEAARKEESLSMETGGLHIIGIKNGAVAGFIVLLLGLAWLIGGFVYMNVIFYYPFFIIVAGIALIINYYVNLNRKLKKEALIKKQEDVLDLEEEL
ncbi:hypothetical protein K6119_00550 [Paracrocinitomix mangrovi]|uniref:hypothetical protein n=1 Tax=Paracrocinitomix mangrovi TaxID=2862509 RepID=UPI001C8CF9DE|nr:hypothetical protein [Paracrocinitomix mangrovi]UKN02004.1 hypothetical protein K6119_00550 [Paracrocinitomix mangrovi]